MHGLAHEHRVTSACPSEFHRNLVKCLLILLIFLYPFIGSFMGVDLGDTGLHIYGYEHIFETPEMLSFTSYMTMLIGRIWLLIFPYLGVWGLNLLEVILEMALALVIYRTLRPYLGEITTLVGILFSVMAMDTYLNVFNHHQLNVLLLSCIMCFEFKAITTNNIDYSILAGILFSTNIWARVGSVTAIVTLFLYLVWWLLENKKPSIVFMHIGFYLLGAVVAAVVFVSILFLFQHLNLYIRNVFRLGDLAAGNNSVSGGYKLSNLLDSFIWGNLKAMASGALFFAAFIVILIGMSMILQKKQDVKNKVISVFLGSLSLGVAIYLLIYAYDVNPAPRWPQMTTGPSFIIGVLYVVAFFCMMYHWNAQDGQPELVYISIMAFFLPLLTVAGTNTGTKHTVLGLWFIAPLTIYAIRSLWCKEYIINSISQFVKRFGLLINKWSWRIAILILCCAFLFKYGDFLYRTTNFDSIDRRDYTASIKSDRLMGLLTTPREADAVNGVIDVINRTKGHTDRKLMLYGGSLLLYYILDMDAYIQPWINSPVYSNLQINDDLKMSQIKNNMLPVVVYCRTNNNYGFYESSYNILISTQQKSSDSGKKDILLDFLDKNEYSLEYVNNYYLVLFPPDIGTTENKDYRKYIVS